MLLFAKNELHRILHSILEIQNRNLLHINLLLQDFHCSFKKENVCPYQQLFLKAKVNKCIKHTIHLSKARMMQT